MNISINADDKRLHTRIPMALDYSMELDGEVYQGKTGNISLGGLYLDSMTPTLDGEALDKTGEIEVSLFDRRMKCLCRVVYVRDVPLVNGVGVCFQSLSDSDFADLKAFIAANN